MRSHSGQLGRCSRSGGQVTCQKCRSYASPRRHMRGASCSAWARTRKLVLLAMPALAGRARVQAGEARAVAPQQAAATDIAPMTPPRTAPRPRRSLAQKSHCQVAAKGIRSTTTAIAIGGRVGGQRTPGAEEETSGQKRRGLGGSEVGSGQELGGIIETAVNVATVVREVLRVSGELLDGRGPPRGAQSRTGRCNMLVRKDQG